MPADFFGAVAADGVTLPFSSAVRAGDFVFASGRMPMNDNLEVVQGGIEIQTRQTLKNIDAALALAGCSLADVVKATVWLDDPRDFWSFNRVYAEFFPGNKPARSATVARMVADAKIEIEVIAYKPR